MISNQVLQNTLEGLKEISRTEFCIIDTEGKVLATTFADFSIQPGDIQAFVESQADSQLVKGFQYFKVCDDYQLEYILVAHGDDEDTYMVGKLAAFQIQNLIVAYKERFDKDSFIKNLLLDNLLLVDIYNQAKKLGITVEQRRVVYLIEPKNPDDTIVLDMIRGIYSSGTGDFVTAVDEGHIILIKSLDSTDDYDTIRSTADMLVNAINTEAMVNVRLSFGTIIPELKEVSQSYKEAGMALDVGRIFYPERNILSYRELGIGRLIHQLPVSLCEMFLEEVFAGNTVDQFDEETLSTVDKFFENSLNISETARQLFVHRNTLVYRLEKIQKQTGLDVRVFEDALTFKIALMVADHMKFIENRK